jgi:hypothetical protein
MLLMQIRSMKVKNDELLFGLVAHSRSKISLWPLLCSIHLLSVTCSIEGTLKLMISSGKVIL